MIIAGNGEFDRVGQIGSDQVQHRLAIHVGLAEIEAEHADQEVDVLPPQRHIEPHLVAEGGELLRESHVSQSSNRRITRQDPHRDEHEREHQPDCRNCIRQPEEKISSHVHSLAFIAGIHHDPENQAFLLAWWKRHRA